MTQLNWLVKCLKGFSDIMGLNAASGGQLAQVSEDREYYTVANTVGMKYCLPLPMKSL